VKGLTHGGTHNLDLVNIIACVLIVVYNVIDLVINKDPILRYFLYLTPFILYPIGSIIIKSNKLSIVLYVIIGLFSLSLDQEYAGATGLLYLYFAYNEIKSNKFALIIVGLSCFSLSIRFILLDISGTNIVVPVVLFTYIFATFYFKVIKRNNSEIADLQRQLKEKHKSELRNIDVINITEEEKAIIKLHCYGNTYEEISKILGLNIVPNTVRRKITAIMKDNNIKNDAHFGHWAFQRV
jgi:DNA-binding CsgD family transcriptional regulator